MKIWTARTDTSQALVAKAKSFFSRRAAFGVAASIVLLLCGWLVNSYRGIDGVRNLSAGESTVTVGAPGGAEQAPLGFTLLLQRLAADYGLLSIRIRVGKNDGRGEIQEIELTEGQPEVQVAGHDLHLQLETFDDETGDLFLLTRTSAGSRELTFSLVGQEVRRTETAGYSVTLIAHRFALDKPRVRVRLAVLEGPDILVESWLEKTGSLGWRGVRITLEGWGELADGTPFATVRAKKAPGRLLFWLGLTLFLGTLGLRWKGVSATGNISGVPAGEDFPRPRQWIFSAAAALVSLLLLEGGARIIELVRDRLGKDHNPYVEMRKPAPVFETVLENGREVYRRTSHHRLILGNQTFLKDKPATGYRVFLLGGSAAGGWPYALGKYNLARFLERKLAALLPGHQVQVLNVAGGTYGSHRVKAVFDEIINYQPDLILIYTGSNEFLEIFAFQQRSPPGVLNNLAIARLGWSVYDVLHRDKPSFEVDTYTARDLASNRVAFAFGKASAYLRDPQQYREVLAKYRHNVDRMVKICKDRGVQVLLMNVPVNIKDWIPNASRHKTGLSASELKVWQDEFREGILHIEREEFSAAADSLRRAVKVDEEHAEAWYQLGVALLRLGEEKEAKAAFTAALEKDAYPFRALPRMQEILNEIAVTNGVPLVDSIGALERLTPDGILGLNLLLDYVHPTLAGQETIALEALKVMAAGSMFPEHPALPVEELKPEAPYAFQPGVDAKAVEAMYNQYLIMRQYDKLDSIYQQYLHTMERAMREDPALGSFGRQGLIIIRQVHPILQDYSRLLRAEKLGVQEQLFTKEEALEIYDRYIDLIRRMEAPRMSREAFLQQVPALPYRSAKPSPSGPAAPTPR